MGKQGLKALQIGMSWFPNRAGGLNRYYYDCVNYLPLANIKFKGLVAGESSVYSDSQGKITAFAAADDSFFKRWLGIRRSFKKLSCEYNYDLLVSHFAFYTFPILNMIRDCPLVTHFHGPWALESDVEKSKPIAIWVKKQLEKQVYQRSQQFIVLSKTFRDLLHREYKIPLDKITIIPGAVDVERFNIAQSKVEARNKLGWSSDRPTMFCVRRLAKRMGLENLVVAMQVVCQQYPNALLYLAGKGELTETLQAQITKLGLDNNIELLGYVADEDLPLCYRAADFSIVPTVALEGFGLIVIESLAAGTPVLGTPIGGIPEILRPFSSDLVFDSFQTKDLAAGIIEALSGKRKLPSSEACLEYVRGNYTWEVIAPQIREVYERAIADKK